MSKAPNPVPVGTPDDETNGTDQRPTSVSTRQQERLGRTRSPREKTRTLLRDRRVSSTTGVGLEWYNHVKDSEGEDGPRTGGTSVPVLVKDVLLV